MKSFKNIHESKIGSIAAGYVVYEFVKAIKKPFNSWDAFKLGLIDEKGNLIRHPETTEETASLGSLSNMTRKIKKILMKYIPNERMVGFLVSTYLLMSEGVSTASLELNEQLAPEEMDELICMLKQVEEKDY